MSPSFASETVDVCVIGSGAGGGPIAYELARAGAKVVVLEKGPWYTQKDFDHDEIATCRRTFFAPDAADEPHVLVRGGGAPERSADGWIAHCVGGGTVHMSGFVYRLHPVDFEMATRYGAVDGAALADWPITYADLAPYYDKVERVVGVSGKAGLNRHEPPRSGDFAYPPLNENPMAGLVDSAAAKLGMNVFPTPRAIISAPTGKRASCSYCKFCGSYGCENDAKSSTAVALIPHAVDTGRCEVRTRCMAYEIATDGADKVTGVRYYDKDGRPQEQKARLVVVSATAVESARLLLNSTSGRFPKGLANGQGLVGKHLTFSTLAKGWGAYPLSKLPEEMRPDHPIKFIQRSTQDLYHLPERKGGWDKGGTMTFMLRHPNAIAAAEALSRRGKGGQRVWGAKLQRYLHWYYHKSRELVFEAFGEFMANPGTFVSISGDVQDRWKIPAAEIHLSPHPEDVKNAEILARTGIAVLRAAGAVQAGVESQGGTTFVLQHGTCRFGKDARASVLDPSCKAWELDNLYVVDGSFMPTSGGVPTTLTIMANSFRVADHLVKRFKARTL